MISRKTDVFVPWHPLPDAKLPMYVDAVLDDNDGFRIIMSDDSGGADAFIVAFENPLAYRNTNESYLLSLWSSVEKEKLGKIFYMIENSSYLKSFNEMSERVYADWDIKHFAFYTVEDCIDVLSVLPPFFKGINS